MAVSGLPEPCTSHAKCMAGLALDMMDLVEQLKYEETQLVINANANAKMK